MSDTTETETETETDTNTDTTDEPSKAELHDRVQQLESTVEKLMPSRRDALRMGVVGLAGAAGLSATSQPADASTGSAGDIGDPNDRPDIFADTVDTNNLTGVSTGGDRQGSRVFLSSDQSISSGSRVKIQFDSVVYDSGNNFDTSTHAWTCPKDGLYIAKVLIRYTGGGSGDRRTAVIGSSQNGFLNDEGSSTAVAPTDSNTQLTTTTVNRYSSGDTIAGYAFNTGNNDTVKSGSDSKDTHLEVAFLGGL